MPDPFGGERPDAKGLDELHTHLWNLWSRVRGQMEEMDAYHEGTFGVWSRPEDTRSSYHPPTGRYLIDHAVDTQLSVDPKVKKFPAGKGQVHRDRADAVEDGLIAVMLDSALKEPNIPWRLAYQYLLQYGYTVMGALWDEGDMEPEPKRREGEVLDEWEARRSVYESQTAGWNPVRIKVPHPSRVLMDPTEMQPEIAIIEAKRYSLELARLTHSKRKYSGKYVRPYEVDSNPYLLVDTLEVWTRKWHGLKLATGDFLVLERNAWGFQPYIHAFSGWGGEQTLKWSGGDPSVFAKGLLSGLTELLRVRAQKASALHNAVLEHGYARMGAKRPEEAAQTLSQGTEAVLPGEQGDVWWLKYPDVSQWLFQSHEMDDREIESATYIRALTGERQQGVTTVGQQMILTQAANKKFYVPSKQIERLATIIGNRILRMVRERGKTITLRGFRLAPGDIEESYDVAVTFQQFDPLIQMDMRRLGMQEVAQGLKSAETYRETDAMIENEAEERSRLLRDEMMKMPEIHREMLLAIIREAGFGDLANRLKAQATAQAQPAAGGVNGATAAVPQEVPAGVPLPTGPPGVPVAPN